MAPEITRPWRFVFVSPEMSVKYPMRMVSSSTQGKGGSGIEMLAETSFEDVKFDETCVVSVMTDVSWSERQHESKNTVSNRLMMMFPDDLLVTPIVWWVIRMFRGHDVSISSWRDCHQACLLREDHSRDRFLETTSWGDKQMKSWQLKTLVMLTLRYAVSQEEGEEEGRKINILEVIQVWFFRKKRYEDDK